METSVEPLLFDYGIHNEASNIRAHVAPLAGVMFVFPTSCAVQVMERFPKKPAFQSGVTGRTAEGHCVKPSSIPNLRRLAISADRLAGFDESLPLGEKGNRAVAIVSAFLKAGRFPLWLEGDFVDEKELQITGMDIRVRGTWKIEVKCDFRASDEYGKPHPRCTGNLYLQTSERNPLRRF